MQKARQLCFLLCHDGWDRMCQFEWFSTAKLLDAKWQAHMSDDDDDPGIKNGVWIGRSIDDDLGFYLRPTDGAWEALWVSMGMFNEPKTFARRGSRAFENRIAHG